MITVEHGDCLEVMRRMGDGSVSAVVTDPPYGLSNTTPEQVTDVITRWAASDREYVPDGKGFMGAAWDAFVPPPAVWDEAIRVLKPGGHLLCFAGTRTMDLMGLAIRLAGFDIRDSVAWLHSQGFPKGKNLKPSFEPIIIARKPFTGSTKANTARYGTGDLNIEENRIDAGAEVFGGGAKGTSGFVDGYAHDGFKTTGKGRWPANVMLDEAQAGLLDAQSAAVGGRVGADLGGASRFFYVAKAPKVERPTVNNVTHPTVKPLALMRHLVRLVATEDGLVLDPFAGSGTTIEACLLEGIDVVGIESSAEYLPLIQERIERSS